MNVAIIIAGGIGSRMGADIPKQFVNVKNKPVIIYTLEAFQLHPAIDAIEVVCIKGWERTLRDYAQQFKITKLQWVVEGGATAQESIRNGVFALEDVLENNDIVTIHDGVRPMLDSEVLSDVIRVCEARGNAATSTPYNEQIFVVDADDPSVTHKFIPRETLRRVATPQAYRFGALLSAYRDAFASGVGVGPSDYVNTMWVALGNTLHLAAGSDRNLKLTNPENLETFRAYLNMLEGGAS